MPQRLLMPAFGRWIAANLRERHGGERPSPVASVRQTPIRPFPTRTFPCLAESRPPSQFDRNQARESWICNSLKPNLPQTFLGPLVRGAHDGKSRIDFSGHRRVAHGARGRELECRFRARRRELPRRAERARRRRVAIGTTARILSNKVSAGICGRKVRRLKHRPRSKSPNPSPQNGRRRQCQKPHPIRERQ